MSYSVTNFSELESFPVGKQGLIWHPIRSRLGIRPFGMNSYTSAEVGGEIVEDHSEETYGHEEVYIVVSGHATFTLDGEEVDAPVGTIVHLPDPSVRRSAVAVEPETRVLAVGGKPGEAYCPRPGSSSSAPRASRPMKRSGWSRRARGTTWPTRRATSTTSPAIGLWPVSARRRWKRSGKPTSSIPNG